MAQIENNKINLINFFDNKFEEYKELDDELRSTTSKVFSQTHTYKRESSQSLNVISNNSLRSDYEKNEEEKLRRCSDSINNLKNKKEHNNLKQIREINEKSEKLILNDCKKSNKPEIKKINIKDYIFDKINLNEFYLVNDLDYFETDILKVFYDYIEGNYFQFYE